MSNIDSKVGEMLVVESRAREYAKGDPFKELICASVRAQAAVFKDVGKTVCNNHDEIEKLKDSFETCRDSHASTVEEIQKKGVSKLFNNNNKNKGDDKGLLKLKKWQIITGLIVLVVMNLFGGVKGVVDFVKGVIELLGKLGG